jgi:hypothetical protein
MRWLDVDQTAPVTLGFAETGVGGCGSESREVSIILELASEHMSE